MFTGYWILDAEYWLMDKRLGSVEAGGLGSQG